jgi:hypothetical protein
MHKHVSVILYFVYILGIRYYLYTSFFSISNIKFLNAIGKFWLTSLDDKFASDFFLCKCSDVKNIGNLKISNYYKRLIDLWSFFLPSHTLYVKEDILDQNIFGNAKFSYNGNALFFSSFSVSCMYKIEDIWDDNTIFLRVLPKYSTVFMIEEIGFQNIAE